MAQLEDLNKNSKHLFWIYRRLIEVHREHPNKDYMLRFKEIIKEMQSQEDYVKEYLKFIEKKKNNGAF